MFLLEGCEYFLQLEYRIDVEGLYRNDVIFLSEQAGYVSPKFRRTADRRGAYPIACE